MMDFLERWILFQLADQLDRVEVQGLGLGERRLLNQVEVFSA